MCFILLFTSVQHTRGCTDLHTACIQLRRPVCIRHGWKTMRSTRKSTRAVFPIFVMGRDHTSTRGLLLMLLWKGVFHLACNPALWHGKVVAAWYAWESVSC